MPVVPEEHPPTPVEEGTPATDAAPDAPREGATEPRRGRRRRGRRHLIPGAAPATGRIVAAARRLGIARLRPEQERIIADALSGRDVVGVLPTGFGKSACYQVPSMVLAKPTILVSPL